MLDETLLTTTRSSPSESVEHEKLTIFISKCICDAMGLAFSEEGFSIANGVHEVLFKIEYIRDLLELCVIDIHQTCSFVQVLNLCQTIVVMRLPISPTDLFPLAVNISAISEWVNAD